MEEEVVEDEVVESKLREDAVGEDEVGNIGSKPLGKVGNCGFAKKVQFPDSHLPLSQKLGPVPHLPSKLQQSPHLPPHRRPPFLGPHLPSSEYLSAPSQAPPQQVPGLQSSTEFPHFHVSELQQSPVSVPRQLAFLCGGPHKPSHA